MVNDNYLQNLHTHTTYCDGIDTPEQVILTAINSAFAVSAAFTFAGHLAFTVAFDPSYLLPVIVGKIMAGILSVIVAGVVYKFTSTMKR